MPTFGRIVAMMIKAEEVSTIKGRGGNATSLLAAFEETTGEYVFVVDGDVESNAAKLGQFIERMCETGADVVIGTKRSRRLLNRMYYTFVNAFLGLPISDTQTGARLFRRETLKYALERALSKTGAFDLELLTIAAGHGARIAEVDMPEQEAVVLATRSKPSYGTVRAILNDTFAIFYRARVLGYYNKCLVPKRPEKPLLVSIVIACPNSSWMLDECLAGIGRQTYRNFEVIVLPDGEDPAAGEAVEGIGQEKIRWIPTGKVRPAEKRNIGIREAKGEIVAFIDDDAYPDSRWLEQATKYFGEDSVGGVGGPGVTPPGDRWLARIGGRVYDNVLVSGNYRYRYKAGGVRMDVEDYPSCNLLVRRDILVGIGGYRTDFWPGEDTLLCKDIIDGWKRIIYDPWVIVFHHRRALFAPHLRQLGRYGFHRGYFCKRFPSNSLRFSYFVPSLFVIYLVAWLALAPFGGRAAFVASIPLAAYLAMVAGSTFSLRPHAWIATALGVVASHICYGVQFLRGFLASKAPCEFIGKDHA